MSSSVTNGRLFSESQKKSSTQRPLMTGRDVQGLAEPLKQLIIQYPTAALASAFLAGVALAWWIKRK